ncbi:MULTISPECIES: GIY-YIG nuclease family protein [unclassified Gemella]|uniref:GIY-YIG nuclease family protein n=1 Tax=unclassified Gemella TaxID=2624949 RepID=UPI00107315AB|nr:MULTISPECIES: GIY-YIG nuclease family protein [unclassified Gemella]MBF0710067.1 GIY-YIG nuclease family protein [Gemella sp. GL1.1]MBF0746146.1 GIY-YIG nuclease family protein [Gemella sp. 19428wG2_WT2a]NYS27411.1 GIY-YIG nuclease family protein [Gemella sp. GL1]TFU60615.1 GIY-YIG nuclease family protein [Gemella sp. WT2a]
MHYTYIVKCIDNTLYTGYTTDIKRRIKTHNRKKGAKYTRTRTPVELYYFEEFVDKSSAMKKEYLLKQFDRKTKIKYVEKNLDLKKREFISEINRGEK